METKRRVRLGAAVAMTVAALVGSAAAYVVAGSAASSPRPHRPVASLVAARHGGSAAPASGRRSAGPTARREVGARAPTSGAPARTPAVPVMNGLLPSAGRLPAGWAATAHTIRLDGLQRNYMTVEPSALTHPVPVVVLMHGRGMNPLGILRISDLIAAVGQAVVIVPAGWHDSWNAGDCCGTAYLHHVDDVAFISDAVANVLAVTPQAEAAQVYAVGFSNGGRMAYELACDVPGMFAGFMAVEAVPVQPCSVRRPFDITIVAQQNDPLLTVDAGQPPKSIEGFIEPTVAATVARMEHLDGCAGAPAVTESGVSVERTWSCAQGSVRYVWYPGGRHDWRAATPATPGATDFVLQLLHHGGPPPHQAP